MALIDELKTMIKGEVKADAATLAAFSHDASVLEVKPEVVVAPRDVADIQTLVHFVSDQKKKGRSISLTARSAGTDMSGGPLSESIILNFLPHFNGVLGVDDRNKTATVLPGTYYRDFEVATLAKDLIMPAYTASREICAIGGMVANDAAGEKTLHYGKVHDFIEKLKVVFSDGKEYEVRALNPHELSEKIAQNDFEGEVYRTLYASLNSNRELLQRAKPTVTKNSAGYALWDIWDGERFDLTRLFTGSQGTLGIITEVTFRLVKNKPVSHLLVAFLHDTSHLGEITNALLPFKPESLEVYDDQTLKLAIRFWRDIFKIIKPKHLFNLLISFLPELYMMIVGGRPKLILLAEVAGEDEVEVIATLKKMEDVLEKFDIKTRITETDEETKKYWTIRRESFNLLRHHAHGKRTVPFIDDVIVNPDRLPEFLPRLESILHSYNLLYTVAGHDGNGNLHIIPLADMRDPEFRAQIPEIAEKVFRLVVEFKGSIDAEHNDGIIRTPYLPLMYSPEVLALFAETKRLFDPLNIFNPGKKVPREATSNMAQGLQFLNSHLIIHS